VEVIRISCITVALLRVQQLLLLTAATSTTAAAAAPVSVSCSCAALREHGITAIGTAIVCCGLD
jgi:hypothetical protein